MGNTSSELKIAKAELDRCDHVYFNGDIINGNVVCTGEMSVPTINVVVILKGILLLTQTKPNNFPVGDIYQNQFTLRKTVLRVKVNASYSTEVKYEKKGNKRNCTLQAFSISIPNNVLPTLDCKTYPNLNYMLRIFVKSNPVQCMTVPIKILRRSNVAVINVNPSFMKHEFQHEDHGIQIVSSLNDTNINIPANIEIATRIVNGGRKVLTSIELSLCRSVAVNEFSNNEIISSIAEELQTQKDVYNFSNNFMISNICTLPSMNEIFQASGRYVLTVKYYLKLHVYLKGNDSIRATYPITVTNHSLNAIYELK